MLRREAPNTLEEALGVWKAQHNTLEETQLRNSAIQEQS